MEKLLFAEMLMWRIGFISGMFGFLIEASLASRMRLFELRFTSGFTNLSYILIISVLQLFVDCITLGLCIAGSGTPSSG